jgi:hypothetical protein
MNKNCDLIHNYSMNEIKKITDANEAETAVINITDIKKAVPKTKKTSAKTAKKAAKSTHTPKKENKSFGSKVSEFTMKKAVPAVKTAFTATGRGIKHAFIEMSEGLAGWIDDTGKELRKKRTDAQTPVKKTAKKVTKKKS